MCVLQDPEELFEVLSQCLLSAVDRDALSGWGAVVHIMYVISQNIVIDISPNKYHCNFYIQNP